MKPTLKVALVQTDIYWENPEANRSEIEEKISSIDIPVDLIVLPEMFTTGFSTNAKHLAEPMNFTTHRWMKQMAKRYDAAICGSLVIKEGENFFNRLLFVEPNGNTSFYDKKHLFGFGGEKETFSSGDNCLIIDYEGWKFCPLICYDLRFPVFSRNLGLAYDVLIYTASWPASRTDVWDTLLKARSLENQCYVLGTNRIGTDGNNLSYSGHSQAINAKGVVLNEISSKSQIVISELSKDELSSFRNAFPIHLDADKFTLN